MNVKKPYRPDKPAPEYLHEVQVRSGSKTYTLRTGMWVSVNRRTNLHAGKYEFLYGEYAGDTLLMYAEGPIGRERRRKTLLESDLKQVHVKTG